MRPTEMISSPLFLAVFFYAISFAYPACVNINHVNDDPGHLTCDCVRFNDECFEDGRCIREERCPEFDGQPTVVEVDGKGEQKSVDGSRHARLGRSIEGEGIHERRRKRCFEKNTMVWTKSESQVDEVATRIPIKKLREGDLVRTMTPNFPSEEDREDLVWTRATDVTVYNGNWTVHSFIFPTGHRLTVTSPHMMIIWPNNEPHFVRADQVKVGDMMKLSQTIAPVTEIRTSMVGSKVAVETEDGTIQGNGVLTAGFCDDNPDMLDRAMKATGILKIYKDRHFGQCYNTMCMDTIAWNNTYMINNELTLKH